MNTTLVTETRYCGDCKHFKEHLGGFPTCSKKLMGVTKFMLVTYKADAGTCFESSESTESA